MTAGAVLPPRSSPATRLERVTVARRQRDDSPYAQTHADSSAAAIRTTNRVLPPEDPMR
jgi:hypothetical protein